MPVTSIPASPHRRFTAAEVARMVDAGVLRDDEPLELLGGELVVVSPQVKARRIEVHAEPHADGRYSTIHVLSGDEPAALPGTDATVRASDFLT